MQNPFIFHTSSLLLFILDTAQREIVWYYIVMYRCNLRNQTEETEETAGERVWWCDALLCECSIT